MNEYTKNDKQELIFDFWCFGKISYWNRKAHKNATHL